jgi:hypothetical protein
MMQWCYGNLEPHKYQRLTSDVITHVQYHCHFLIVSMDIGKLEVQLMFLLAGIGG